jgi:hypothetical protein
MQGNMVCKKGHLDHSSDYGDDELLFRVLGDQKRDELLLLLEGKKTLSKH